MTKKSGQQAVAHPEIPMLRGSVSYAARLIEAARGFKDTRYRFYRRVNWSHRYCEDFYQLEVARFLEEPDDYLGGKITHAPELSDVYRRKLNSRQLFIGIMKVFAHWLFRFLGRVMDRRIRARGISIYRKGYVDDLELVFDPKQPGVVRAIFPFPLGLRRQVRYLKFLIRNRFFFKLDGYAYSLCDFGRFLARRDVASLVRLEARAQYRLAREILGLGVGLIQISDEYDLTSLEFTRYLTRFPVRVVNSAHGVGKYLPYHCYEEFHVITTRQQEYYHPLRNCVYIKRRLNDAGPPLPQRSVTDSGKVTTFVLLGQVGSPTEYIAGAENGLIDFLRNRFAGRDDIRLIYKPHPNMQKLGDVRGFKILKDIGEVNGQPGTIFASFYSTSQIEPKFKGAKVLVKTDVIRPEIFFDDDQTIQTFEGLAAFINAFRAKREA